MFVFLKAILIGFSIAAPVGPIGLLCIQRTLSKGKLSGFSSGAGAATADAFYGAIAALGLSLISDFLINQQALFKYVGGIFLIYLGLNIFFSRNNESKQIQETNVKKSLFKDYLSTFFLTITNPVTILAFLAIFSSLNLANISENKLNAMLIVQGVFIGSLLWWFILSYFANLFKNKVQLKYINIISALIITGFGIFALFY